MSEETRETALADQVQRQIGIGHNSGGVLLDADMLLSRFQGDGAEPGVYTKDQEATSALLAEINGKVEGIAGVPAIIETAAENGIVAAYMSRLRDTIKTIHAYREAEKAPYLKAERAAQNYFAGMTDRLEKARDVLQARGNAYTARLVAEDRQRRNREAQEAAERARLEREASARAAQEAADLEAAAARARKPENIAKLEEAAATKAVEADTKKVDALIAGDKATTTGLAAMASSADIARTRHETGHLSTAKQVPYVAIEDAELLDLNKLRPYIAEKVLLSALKAWAKSTGHKHTMPGAVIEFRDVGDYR